MERDVQMLALKVVEGEGPYTLYTKFYTSGKTFSWLDCSLHKTEIRTLNSKVSELHMYVDFPVSTFIQVQHRFSMHSNYLAFVFFMSATAFNTSLALPPPQP